MTFFAYNIVPIRFINISLQSTLLSTSHTALPHRHLYRIVYNAETKTDERTDLIMKVLRYRLEKILCSIVTKSSS